MHRIHYAGDSILTGSAIARGVLDYAQALAQVGASATVDVPTRESDGSRGHVEMLIGPASQLSAHEEDEVAGEELEDDTLVQRMHTAAVRLRRYGPDSPTAGIISSDQRDDWSVDDEY